MNLSVHPSWLQVNGRKLTRGAANTREAAAPAPTAPFEPADFRPPVAVAAGDFARGGLGAALGFGAALGLGAGLGTTLGGLGDLARALPGDLARALPGDLTRVDIVVP